MEHILKADGVTRDYLSAGRALRVLDDITFSVAPGEMLAVVGPSGSGKTTLLGLCAGLDLPTSGTIILADQDLGALDEDERALLRNTHVGFIFQDFQLVPTLTAVENVMIPLELRRERHARRSALEHLERVGLSERGHHLPAQLSGGEQQRVSLARAFINRPAILFADEPTGNLDDATGAGIEQLLFDLNAEHGTTLIIVTHDMELAGRTNRIIQLRGGRIVADRHVPHEISGA